MANLIRVPVQQPTYKAYAKIIALLDAGYRLINADSVGMVIVLVFEREEVKKDDDT